MHSCMMVHNVMIYSVLKCDDFTGRLFQLYKEVKSINVQVRFDTGFSVIVYSYTITIYLRWVLKPQSKFTNHDKAIVDVACRVSYPLLTDRYAITFRKYFVATHWHYPRDLLGT